MFMYSVILSRGVSHVQSDQDAGSSLMGDHGYATQDMVNLMIGGKAASNVFNGEKDLDGTILGGVEKRYISFIFCCVFDSFGFQCTSLACSCLLTSSRFLLTTCRCEVGFLSLFESYNYIEVGSFLKEPRYPIWVVCSESHYSVLFSLERYVPCVFRISTLFFCLYVSPPPY